MSTVALLACAPLLLAASPPSQAVTLGQAPGARSATPRSATYLTPAALGGEAYDPFAPPVVSLGLVGPNTFLYQLNLPERRWKEEFAVVRPDPAANFPVPYPVLTLFHGYGETPQAVLNSTALATEAANRGWIVIVPLCAHIFSYGIDYGQDNIEDVFEFVQALAPLDLDRVYAVGFSMGGGAAVSYAARHLDPQHVRIAAVVNHTGSTSLRNTYEAAGIQAVFESPLMFSASPSAAPFRYQLSSAIDLKPGLIVDPETDMVRNLLHVPVLHYTASSDPLQYLSSQSFQTHLRLLFWGGTSTWNSVNSAAHSWSTLPLTILDDLEQLTLEAPTPGSAAPILADRDGRWHAYEVRQARSKRFSSFQARTSPANNRVELTDLDNVRSIGFAIDDATLGLRYDRDLALHVQSRTAASFEVAVSHKSAPPSAVIREGVTTTAWTYSATNQTLTLYEVDAALGATWTIRP
ncbi:MAG: alpha/beta hydrolase [Planctomycetota bacterium]